MVKQTGKKFKFKSSKRAAPAISEASLQDKRDLQKRRRKRLENGEPTAEGPIVEMLVRVRAKEAKRKAQHESEDQETVKKRCQREERMAILQLKAYCHIAGHEKEKKH